MLALAVEDLYYFLDDWISDAGKVVVRGDSTGLFLNLDAFVMRLSSAVQAYDLGTVVTPVQLGVRQGKNMTANTLYFTLDFHEYFGVEVDNLDQLCSLGLHFRFFR